MSLKEILEMAQSFASAVVVSADDKDEWALLRMEARRVRNIIHEYRTGEKVK